MAACTNNGGSIAKRAVTAALVGVLSVGTVPMAALAAGVDGIQTMAVGNAQDNWANGTFTFNQKANADGSYTVTSGDVLALESAVDASGKEYGSSDVTVLFYNRGSNSNAAGNPDNAGAVEKAKTIETRSGSMPKDAGDYWVVVFQGDLVNSDGTLHTVKDNESFSDAKALNSTYKFYKLKVVNDATSLEGAQAFQLDDSASDNGVSDTTFNYTGGTLNVAFEVNGEILDPSDVNVVCTKGSATGDSLAYDTDKSANVLKVTDAGTYTARLTAKDGSDFTGSVDVTFEVKGIDLSSDSVAIAPHAVGDNNPTGGADGLKITSTGALLERFITVNGMSLSSASGVKAQLIAVNDKAISSGYSTYYDLSSNEINVAGKYTFKLTPSSTSTSSTSTNVTGETIVDAYVVNQAVAYAYDGTTLTSGSSLGTFNAAKGKVFTPEALSATISGPTDVDFACTVTKDGKEVTSYTEPGTYEIVLDTPVVQDSDGNYLYAGHYEGTFTVDGKDYKNSTVYVSADGKVLKNNDSLDYTGKAVTPSVVVRDTKNKLLTEGTDYTVKLTDAEGNEVESATEVGDYKVVVTFNGDYNATDDAETISFKIGKATIKSAKATADFFGIPEKGAATPTFVGKTTSGQEFALDANDISVRYYEALKDASGKYVPDVNGDYQADNTKPVKAEDLTDEGVYIADINILSTAKNITGSNIEVAFELSKNAVFTDVDANAWYAQVVAKAYSNYYVNGIANTNFFAPEAQITRADVACILYNMAGGNVKNGTVVGDDEFSFSDTDGYVTGFDDVDGHAYYAQAIAWAHASGVVNGYDGNFRPTDKVTREEFAAMLANFAKVKGDYAAPSASALDGVSDASTVSDWARESVAWAVENGIMGNGGYVAGQSSIIRAEVAAMAVNYQPENLIDQTR